ncbi:MAG: SRPBCC family protein [Anaerolineae bacterium]
MTILDHRILIPQSPHLIWDYISDLTRNPSWQEDCSDVSILTTRRNGAGVRWRYSTTDGAEYVIEITAWYDGLGYEYTFVDGAPFRESKGRIRLQEIAEGTIVQWTFNYETRGVLAGVRNTISIRRKFETVMVTSLKNLWKVIQSSSAGERPREVKSLMRDAPDYEARTQYKSRQSSLQESEGFVENEVHVRQILAQEPPVTEEDTRPRIPISLRYENEPHDVAIEIGKQSQLNDGDDLEVYPNKEAVLGNVKPSDLPINELEELISVEEKFVSERVTHIENDSALPGHNPSIVVAEDESKLDTAEISVFDVFGLPRPSQTQQIQPITIPESSDEFETAFAQDPSARARGLRIGLRLRTRQKHILVRLPK